MNDHKLTPREPSPEMVKAAARECNDISFNRIAEQGLDGDDFRAIWRAMHDAAPQPAALPERWVVVRETALDVGDGDDVRTGGKPELGYALISDAATFTSEHAALAAIRSGAKPLPLGWVVIRLSRLLPDLYPHPAAQQPAALPEARYTEDEIADACMLAEIPDSKFESLLLVLKGKQ